MRILLAPHGTRGDVQPMLALADALAHRGHAVRFLVPANFTGWIAARGFEAHSNRIDVEQLLRAPGTDFHSFRWQAHYLSEVLTPRLFESVAEVSEEIDLIVGAGVQTAGPSIAEWRGAAYCNVAFCPCAVPNRESPPPTVKTQTLPKWANSLLWQIGIPVSNLLLRRSINDGRARLGLGPIDNVLEHFAGNTIVAADRDIAPMGSDAPPGTVQTDAWFDDVQAPMSSRVEEFLRLDPPPVYIGFGSMIASDAAALARDAIIASRAVGRRAVVAGGWAKLDRYLPDDEDVCVVDSLPHHLALPHVGAAVHHGGAGTTTAAARAAVPQIVLPHSLDQFYWAHRVEALNLGPPGLPVEIVNAEILTARISAALTDHDILQSVASLGNRIRTRNGVHAAVAALEHLDGG